MSTSIMVRLGVLGAMSVATLTGGCVYRREFAQFERMRLVESSSDPGAVQWLSGFLQNLASDVVFWLVIGSGFVVARSTRRDQAEIRAGRIA